MDIYQVVFEGRERDSEGRFSRHVVLVQADSIQSKAIIAALGDFYEVNGITLRENLTQGCGLIEIPANLHTLKPE